MAKAFADKIGTTLPVLADVNHDVARSYAIFDDATHRVRRTSFTVDGGGVIRSILQDREALDVDPGLEACSILFSVDSTSGR